MIDPTPIGQTTAGHHQIVTYLLAVCQVTCLCRCWI